MRQMVWYELKKYVLTRRHVLLLLAFTALMAGWLFLAELICVFERPTTQRFFAQLGSSFSEDDVQRFQSERDELEQELFEISGDGARTQRQEELAKKGRYADTKIEDYGLLGDALDCVEAVETRNRNTAFLADSGNPAYTSESNRIMVDRRKLTAVAQNMPFALFACIAVIFFLSASFSTEFEHQLYPVVCVTSKGYWGVCMAKLLTGLLTALACSLYFCGLYLLLEYALVGMTFHEWALPLFLAEGFELCASGASMLDLLLGQFLAALLGSVLLVFFLLLLSRRIRRGLYTMLAGLGVFGVLFLPDLLYKQVYHNYAADLGDWYLIPEPEFYRLIGLEKILNPISALQFQYYLEEPRVIRLFGSAYPAYCGPVLAALAVIGVLGALLFWEKKRGL